MRKRSLIPILYIAFLMLPIYWLVAMSFKTTNEILSGFSLFPQTFTLENYRVIFTDPTWYWGYFNSIIYVSLNTVISVCVALPAAYAFSRYRFLGDKQLFFLAVDQPNGPGCCFCTAFLSAVFFGWLVRHTSCRGSGTLLVQHPSGCLDPRRVHGRCSKRTGRNRLC